MAERTGALGRFFPFSNPTLKDHGAASDAIPPIDGRTPPAPTVGGLLEGLLAERRPAAALPRRPTTETIDGVERIEARLRTLAARGATAFLRTESAVVRGHVLPTFADGPFPLQLHFPQPVPETPFELDVEGYDALHRFEVRRCLRIGDRIAVPLPERVLQVRQRRARRVAAPAGTFVGFAHPAFPELEIRRAVRDVARGGICFELRPEQDLLAPGLRIRDLVVTPIAGPGVCFDGVVRVLHPPREGRGPAVGVQITPRSAVDAARWEQIVGDLLTPTTQLGGTWSEDSWELFAASGYFALSGKTEAHFVPLKAPFAAAVRKVDAAPQLGCQVSWPSERGIEASLSLIKPYTHTWFGYQMAKRPGDPPDGTPGRAVLRDIHLRAYEHAQADPDLRWLWGVVQDAAKWSKLVHYDLPQRYVDTGLACILPFQTLEIDTLGCRRDEPGVAVDVATGDEQALLLDHVARNRPWVYREAFDLVPERFALGALRDAWAQGGLSRERALLVARRAGRPVAAALVETAEPGAHLFNLLDIARLYALDADGTSTFTALLAASAAWYRARGRERFTCLLEEGDAACAAGLPARDLGRASHTLLSSELLPSLLEHVHEVTAPRLPRT